MARAPMARHVDVMVHVGRLYSSSKKDSWQAEAVG